MNMQTGLNLQWVKLLLGTFSYVVVKMFVT